MPYATLDSRGRFAVLDSGARGTGPGIRLVAADHARSGPLLDDGEADGFPPHWLDLTARAPRLEQVWWCLTAAARYEGEYLVRDAQASSAGVLFRWIAD